MFTSFWCVFLCVCVCVFFRMWPTESARRAESDALLISLGRSRSRPWRSWYKWQCYQADRWGDSDMPRISSVSVKKVPADKPTETFTRHKSLLAAMWHVSMLSNKGKAERMFNTFFFFFYFGSFLWLKVFLSVLSNPVTFMNTVFSGDVSFLLAFLLFRLFS